MGYKRMPLGLGKFSFSRWVTVCRLVWPQTSGSPACVSWVLRLQPFVIEIFIEFFIWGKQCIFVFYTSSHGDLGKGIFVQFLLAWSLLTCLLMYLFFPPFFQTTLLSTELQNLLKIYLKIFSLSASSLGLCIIWTLLWSPVPSLPSALASPCSVLCLCVFVLVVPFA